MADGRSLPDDRSLPVGGGPRPLPDGGGPLPDSGGPRPDGGGPRLDRLALPVTAGAASVAIASAVGILSRLENLKKDEWGIARGKGKEAGDKKQDEKKKHKDEESEEKKGEEEKELKGNRKRKGEATNAMGDLKEDLVQLSAIRSKYTIIVQRVHFEECETARKRKAAAEETHFFGPGLLARLTAWFSTKPSPADKFETPGAQRIETGLEPGGGGGKVGEDKTDEDHDGDEEVPRQGIMEQLFNPVQRFIKSGYKRTKAGFKSPVVSPVPHRRRQSGKHWGHSPRCLLRDKNLPFSTREAFSALGLTIEDEATEIHGTRTLLLWFLKVARHLNWKVKVSYAYKRSGLGREVEIHLPSENPENLQILKRRLKESLGRQDTVLLLRWQGHLLIVTHIFEDSAGGTEGETFLHATGAMKGNSGNFVKINVRLDSLWYCEEKEEKKTGVSDCLIEIQRICT